MKKLFFLFLHDESGNSAIEFALASILLVFMLLGEIELISYIMVKERINRTADETSQLLGHITGFSTNKMEDRLSAASLISYPQGVNVSAVYCLNNNLVEWMNPKTLKTNDIGPLNTTIRDGVCGNMAANSGAVMTPLENCTGEGQDEKIQAAFTNLNKYITAQYVAVKAQCAYSPIINVRNIVTAREITATSFITLRYRIKNNDDLF